MSALGQEPTSHLFNDFVGAADQGKRDRQTQRFGGPHINNQFDSAYLLDRQVTGLLAFENATGIIARQPV
jgi:hypothetical protein